MHKLRSRRSVSVVLREERFEVHHSASLFCAQFPTTGILPDYAATDYYLGLPQPCCTHVFCPYNPLLFFDEQSGAAVPAYQQGGIYPPPNYLANAVGHTFVVGQKIRIQSAKSGEYFNAGE